MRNTLFAAAAAFVLIAGTAPTFAADAPKTDTQSQSQANQSTKSAECSAVMADQKSHTAAEVAKCQTQ